MVLRQFLIKVLAADVFCLLERAEKTIPAKFAKFIATCFLLFRCLRLGEAKLKQKNWFCIQVQRKYQLIVLQRFCPCFSSRTSFTVQLRTSRSTEEHWTLTASLCLNVLYLSFGRIRKLYGISSSSERK